MRKWVILYACTISVINAAPREYSIDELITKPRPGEEYVNIQTMSKGKVDLKEQAFSTSHRIPELSKTNRTQEFQTSHSIPSNIPRISRSLAPESESELNVGSETKVSYSVVEGTTIEPPLERVVTKTSIKMSKSKKIQKSLLKSGQDLVDTKSDDGFIDENANADEEEQKIMKKKFLKNEGTQPVSEEFLQPFRFNVPLEEEVKDITYDKHLLIPNPVLITTQEPPITTFNYKNIYDKTKKGQSIITIVANNESRAKDSSQQETSYIGESIKTAESKTIAHKKETKQEKKDKYKKEEGNQKEDPGFYILPVNKQQSKHKEESYDFVDVEEKVLVPAGSSPSQSSRINIKKGPNGQDYEYEYVYYYYDEDEDEATGNGGSGAKEGKTVLATTEKVFNGHDGPAKEDREQNFVHATSTSGNKYLPTEAPKSKGSKKSRTEEVEVGRNEAAVQNVVGKNARGGIGSRFTSTNKQSEVNEVVPSSNRSGFRARSRTPTTTEEIPSVGEERLPSNTRFPPRSRANNNGVATPPQPQEVPTRSNRNREGSSQSRIRIPNSSSFVDSSSFRTHASDASVDEDSGYEAELHRKANVRGQSFEGSSRRGVRPATGVVETSEISDASRRPAIRKPVEEKRPKLSTEEVETETQETLPKVPLEDVEKTPKVPFEYEVPTASVGVNQQENSYRTTLEAHANRQIPVNEDINEQEYHQREQQHQQHQLTENFNSEIQGRPEEGRGESITTGVGFENTYSQSTSEHGQSQDTQYRTVESTTENQNSIGLTSVMMEKVALDLYAILQQAQNENNFVDGNSTDITTDSYNEGPTEYSAFDEDSTAIAGVITTTTTTSTTTTPAPTTTTTTTTAAAPVQAAGRGRYRGRAPAGKSRAKVTTTTTEVPEEVTSPKTRGRFHANHGGTRGSGLSFARKPSKTVAKEQTQEASVSEETPKATSERSFGERPRNRFRASTKAAVASTTAVPPPSAPAGGVRGLSTDRFHSRRRGGTRGSLPAVQQTAVEEIAEEEKQEVSQDGHSEEGIPPVPAVKPIRPRIGGVRPLRPGPRAPLLLPQRGVSNAAPSTTQAPEEIEEVEKEEVEHEVQFTQQTDENQETSTPPSSDALTRLKSRPRLRIGPNTNHQRPQTPAPPPTNRRKLVSSLLPKRKPNEEKPVQKVEDTEERIPEEIPIEEDQSSSADETSSTTTEAEAKGLTGLLAGKRRNLNRRPGTLYSRAPAS
ncbi:hypothetical protein RUM43_012948 [Polyplax serrata]|uniref:Uncharacterized protein n=1 Tax=Polyplax serrata TaxID=468196 RepID=A0AAN8NQK8_POLSC